MDLGVVVDTSFAGINLTGVGKYSRRMVEGMTALSTARGMRLTCFGPACRGRNENLPLGGLYQEWPTYTQVYLPVRLALARRPVHIVHSTSHLGPLWGPGRHIVTVHDVIFKRFPSDYQAGWLRITQTLLPLVLGRASVVIADSGATRSDLERFYPRSRGKIRVVYPGVDQAFGEPVEQSEISALRAKHGLGDGPYVLCLGPWVRRKNIGVVIRAFGQIAEEWPEVQLVVTGKAAPGMQSGQVLEAMGQLPVDLRERVRAIGHVPWEQVPALVKGAAVLTYPSLFEGFGLPPLEAMAAGTPVIASSTPAVSEATADAAILVPPEDINGWTKALERVLGNPAEAARLSSAGLKRSAGFTWQRCCEETARIYFQVARRHRANPPGGG